MKRSIYKFIIIFLAIIISGCVNIKLPSSASFEQTHYSLSVKLPKLQPAKTNSGNLEVSYPKIATKFSGQSFVYKSQQYNFITDAYNIFLDLPASEIQQIVINYLQKTGKFKFVAAETYPAKAQFILQTNILKLYADYTDHNNPRGTIAIRFTLFDLQNKNNILLNKDYEANISLSQKSSTALIEAWDIGLTQILQQLNHHLQAISLDVKPVDKKPLFNPSPWQNKKPVKPLENPGNHLNI